MLQTFLSDTHNLMLIAIAVASGAMLAWPLIKGANKTGTLSTLQATQLINQKDAVVIDIRDQAEYQRGHILNAKNFPDKVFTERKVELEKLKSAPIIVSCDNGQRAGPAAQKLREMGLPEVFALQGGLNAWRDAGLPVTK